MQASPEIIAFREIFGKLEADAAEALGPCPVGVAETWIDITLPDGWVSRTLVTYPTTSASGTTPVPAPLVVGLFGGGFQGGSAEQFVLPARAYALRFGAVVACPSYKLCPEHPFPASVHSAYSAAAWLSNVDHLYGGVPGLRAAGVAVDPSRSGFVLLGVSAGANMAAAIAGVLATKPATRDKLLGGNAEGGEGLPRFQAPLTGLFACCPMLTTEETVPAKYAPLLRSRTENADAPNLTTAFVHQVQANLAADFGSPWWSPLAIADGDFAAAQHPPRVFLQACSADCLRDDAVIYKDWLAAAGVADTKLHMLEGHTHSSWVTPSMQPEDQRKEMKASSLDGMAWLLGKEWDNDVEAVY